ncbi:MAG: DNA-formamidopyrimidine glycosylase family protein [Armatimonadota bacterium]|nr:DNA-formamidopyrimidine glycosylase family protein [Armatimonadota bacterium]MDR7453878.1 DNA-formamidopyrimidine glycosylase family protein [Armatimonadota bacterium]MDR7457576.1 DNA-formamidopyrimidine glycosylase family protein [Armatimonadota bacterium]MDR7495678.1 DNA-formamidopyrimidine glycosylase family protein [Armatimonadota bacterium]MDR7511076.1 DNA-formamidopyrimidine glycosylase family protein [Armatimonadota bacterium]
MPELPDVVVYVERLAALFAGRRLDEVRLRSPFVLRTVDPPLDAAAGRTLRAVRRVGKRVVLALDGDLFVVIHLMIAGRLRLRRASARPGRDALAVFRFGADALWLTEAGTRRRASLHVVQGDAALAALDPGGLDVLTASPEAFTAALRRERHTVKRALTDPALFDGIGNAYSDEILHLARLSPVIRTDRLTDEEVGRLYAAARETLAAWIGRLRDEVGEGFPKKVTAHREGMRVHGRFRQPCPVCGAPIQRVVWAENEMNYCPVCQTGGKVLSDRVLARLLGRDWAGWGLRGER